MRTVIVQWVLALVATIPSIALAQSAGPNGASVVVSDPSFPGATWSFPDEAIVSDDTYAQAPIQQTSTSHLLKATGFGFGLPSTAVIRGIVVRVEKRSLLNLTRDNAVRIVKGGSAGSSDRSAAGPWAASDMVSVYGTSGDLWDETWTAADINSPQFGFGISARDSGLDLAAVDAIDVTVHYSLCGDSIVSPGEQCDDGNLNPDDCCSPTCSFEPGAICRPSIGACDPAETCSAGSAVCPADVVQLPGSTCADDGDVCTSDTCDNQAQCVHAAVSNASCQYKPGQIVVVKPAKLAKLVAKDTFVLPSGPDAPTVAGGTVQFLDTVFGGAGSVTFNLPASGWQALGNPPGTRGFKYKGAGTPADPCKRVLIKPTVIKAVCKGSAVALTPPFAGDAGIVLQVGATPIRYCAEFKGTTVKNTDVVLKRKNAPAPAMCSMVQPTPTPTVPTRTPTFTHTPTATISPTPSQTPTATDTFTAGPSATPTNTGLATSTPTPTRTPTTSSAVCGNGLIEAGETCANCAPDCQVGPCTSPGNPLQSFRVDFTPPAFQTASSITVLIGYRDNRVHIPNSGNDPMVGARIVMRQTGATVTPNDLNYALRVVYSRAGGINPGRIFVVNFDSCTSVPPVTASDFTCIMEGCSSSSGPIDGCSCAVTTP